jgi:hypothetical protein
MGGDGGSIPGRDVLVRLKQRQAVESDPAAATEERLAHCAVSAQPLHRPVVACELGNLYNKEAIIAYLLSKGDVPAFRHIRGLKDLIPVTVTFERGDNGAAAGAVSGPARPPAAALLSSDALTASSSSSSPLNRLVCPLTGLPANGRTPFVVARPCGCVLSLKALRDFATPSSSASTSADAAVAAPCCPACGAPLRPASARAPGEPAHTPLAPDTAAADMLRGYAAARRAEEDRKKAEKKDKKADKKDKKDKKKDKDDDGTGDGDGDGDDAVAASEGATKRARLPTAAGIGATDADEAPLLVPAPAAPAQAN